MVSDYGLDKYPHPFHVRVPPGARRYTSTQTSPECPPPPARDWLSGMKQTIKEFAAYKKYNVYVNTVNTAGRAWMDSLTGKNEKKVPNEFYWPLKSPDMQYTSSIKIQCKCQKRWNVVEKSLESWCIPTLKSPFSDKLVDLLILSPLPTAFAIVALGESPKLSSKNFFGQKALL